MLIPEYGLNLEHDGTLWHNKICDNVRDEYIKEKFSEIKIKRLVDFKDNSKKDLLNLKTILSSLRDKLESPIIFDYTDYVVKSFIDSYITELTLINIWHYKKGLNFDELDNKISTYFNYEVMKNLVSILKECVWEALKSLYLNIVSNGF